MLYVSKPIIEETLTHLRAGGARNCETAVLWLGTRGSGTQLVQEVYRPEQRVDVDYFHISPDSMRAMMAHLRQRRLQILAQVHSHPEHAFHSKADDKWAIVRHQGALSLVVPWFAARTTADAFFSTTAVFSLDADDAWRPVHAGRVLEMTL